MGFGPYDQAGMSVVAYAKVAVDGTSSSCNSGVTTSRVSPGSGLYYVDLPPDKLGPDADMFFSVETFYNNATHTVVPTGPVGNRRYLLVFLGPTGTPVDTAFSVIVFRPLLSS